VHVDRALAEEEVAGDLAVRAADGDEAHDLALAAGEARAARYGLPPVRWPEPWPGHYLAAMRACLVAAEAGTGERFARTALRMGFAEGRDLSLPAEVAEAARRSGLEPDAVLERITAPEVKQGLIDATAAAHARGVFGVPTLDDGERLLWGDDRIP